MKSVTSGLKFLDPYHTAITFKLTRLRGKAVGRDERGMVLSMRTVKTVL